MKIFGPFNCSSTVPTVKQDNIIFWFCTLTWNYKKSLLAWNRISFNTSLFRWQEISVNVLLYQCISILRNELCLRDLSIWYVLIISSGVINLYVSFLVVKLRVVKKLFLHCSMQSMTPVRMSVWEKNAINLCRHMSLS